MPALDRFPKISAVRPPILGVPGKLYFHVNKGCIRDSFSVVWKGFDIFLDGGNVTGQCFELDCFAGWVGVYAVNCNEQTNKRKRNVKRWIRGAVALTRTPEAEARAERFDTDLEIVRAEWGREPLDMTFTDFLGCRRIARTNLKLE